MPGTPRAFYTPHESIKNLREEIALKSPLKVRVKICELLDATHWQALSEALRNVPKSRMNIVLQNVDTSFA